MLTAPSFSFVDRYLLQKVLDATGQMPIQVKLDNGPAASPPGSSPIATVHFRDRRTLAGLVLNPEISFGDSYSEGRIEVEGDLVNFLDTLYRSLISASVKSWSNQLASLWLRLMQVNGLQGSRKNIHHHYDLTTEFYKLWLDSELVYTCAYFPSPTATLEEAQLAKMDYVCRKLDLRPGETVVEAGCGWGALALYMARHYGVSVKAFNISHEQIVHARQRARAEGLSHQVEFIEDDYRNISGRSDVFVSVGMLEHVGQEHYEDFGRVIQNSLGATGRGLLHFIGRNHKFPLSVWVRKRIFPGAYPPTLREAAEMLEPYDFSVLDVENLRLHYAKTLEHWLERFEKSEPEVAAMFDSRFARAWKLYLAGSLVGFKVGTLQLFQMVFAGPQCPRLPWTRDALYAAHPHEKRRSQWTHAMS